jgi:Phage tail protein
VTTTARLVDEITGESIPLVREDCNGPIFTTLIDYGWPAPRAVAWNIPQNNGQSDITQLWGERSVSWAGYVAPTTDQPYPAVVWDKIRALSAPARRPWLYYIEDGWPTERRMQLRGDAIQSPLTRELGPVIIGSAVWKVPAGAQESADSRDYIATPSGFSTGGVCFDQNGGCFASDCAPNMVPGYIASTTIVVNNGDVITYPYIIFIGAVTNPKLVNLTTKQTIALTGALAAGTQIWVDTQNKTVRENNDPNLNRLNLYDYTQSTGMYLAPGVNEISYTFSAVAGGSCVIRMRDRWI